MSAELPKVDVLAVMSDAASDMNNYEATLRLMEARAAVAELIEALDNIGGLSRALRQGGPDPMDLQDLSDALNEAVDTAHGALARVGGAA